MTRDRQLQGHLRRSIEAVSDAKVTARFPRVQEHLGEIEHQLWMLLIMADGLVRAEDGAKAESGNLKAEIGVQEQEEVGCL